MWDVDVVFQPAHEQAAAIRSGQVRAAELVETYLARIEQLDGAIGAYVTLAADQVREAAAEADRVVGTTAPEELPLLHGVPVSIKDVCGVEGLPTTLGIGQWRDRVADADAVVVSRVRQAGAVILGKTLVPELAVGCVTEPPAFWPCRNPWDLGTTPGGSSGGAAAALAAGLCALAHGSDGGGSIRIPAALCGLVGLKPARGRITLAPNPPSSNAVHGVLARDVRDAAIALDVMHGAVPDDPFVAAPPGRPFVEAMDAGVDRPLRVAVTDGGRSLPPAWGSALADVAGLLDALGHRVVEADPGHGWLRLQEVLMPGAGAGQAQLVRDGVTLDHPINQWLAERGASLTDGDLTAALGRAEATAAAIEPFFAAHDVLVTPLTTGPALAIGAFSDLPPADWMAAWYEFVPYSTMWNFSGQPAISLPLGWDTDGRPIGIQVVGPPEGEALLLALAHQLEQARPWLGHHPDLADLRTRHG